MNLKDFTTNSGKEQPLSQKNPALCRVELELLYEGSPEQRFCSPWTTSSSITWELVRKQILSPTPRSEARGAGAG